MKPSINPIAGLGLAAWMFALGGSAVAAESPEPKFTAITLDDHIQIGYGLAIADVDGDGHPDILLADKKQFVWYRNPGPSQARDPAAWHKYLLAENLTEDDNVCIAAQDIDGDGKCEIAVGAAWKPSDTEKSGAVFYLIPPADRTQPWTPVKFPAVEPTTHRMRWIKVADGKWGLLVAPLHGRGNKNGEGAPAKVLLYHPPADPRAEWPSEVVADTFHMTHNFVRLSVASAGGRNMADRILLGGKEGLMSFRPGKTQWEATAPVMAGDLPAGVGEVRVGSLVNGVQFITTVEPMHGNMLAVYLPQKAANGATVLKRQLLTDKLVEGHALACGNLLGGYPGVSASDQIAVGWRGKGGTVDTPIGVAVWAPLDAKGEQWRETVLDPNGMACEDLQIADLNGNGKLDIIASGRRTHNVKIYFNDTAPPPRP
ncbi:FG-GAP repeat protein [Chthoniobacter flavus Ellin428]|uniref:FG-GAP repeat protein n=1 Tax=Chthoniobacter flavus Ellin428 TaxID=497964 RepID=B4CVB7_9BACT|nr:VCBS repeat-containing protein [Chthoniobacter flavus]EDY21359.1 FG-GAP repeat protein [Chthoniobacter flavus Ellin428]TCO95323.1 VCBS repeat protein [Chthoniobacter flavus]